MKRVVTYPMMILLSALCLAKATPVFAEDNNALVDALLIQSLFAEDKKLAVTLTANGSCNPQTLPADTFVTLILASQGASNNGCTVTAYNEITGNAQVLAQGAVKGAIQQGRLDGISPMLYKAVCQNDNGDTASARVEVNRVVYGVGGPRHAAYVFADSATANKCRVQVAGGGKGCNVAKVGYVDASKIPANAAYAAQACACGDSSGGGQTFEWGPAPGTPSNQGGANMASTNGQSSGGLNGNIPAGSLHGANGGFLNGI